MKAKGIKFSGFIVLLAGFFCASGTEARPLPTQEGEPQVKMLALPQPVLDPPIAFLEKEPAVDGRLDEELSGLARRSFAVLAKMNPANPDTQADYRLGYGSDFLYLFVEVEAEQLVCRDRGYQNGDGFILVLNRPLPNNAESPELFMLGYHPTGKPQRPFAQMVWKRNDDWLFSPLGERSLFCVTADGKRIGFETLLRWEDVHPYHPWLSEGIGFNLILAKAVGETDVNYLAVSAKPAPGAEAFNAYSRLAFARPVVASGLQSAAVLERGHLLPGEPLPVKIAAVSSSPVTEELSFVFMSGEGMRVSRQAVSVDVAAGVSVHDAVLDISDLTTGGYTVRWESRQNRGAGTIGLTMLPPFDAAAKEAECRGVENRLSSGSVQTIRFLLAEIEAQRAKLRPYDTCAGLRARLERVDTLLRAAASGDDRLAKQRGLLRRAFQSHVDGTLQPYTVFVPADLEPGKKYAAMVYLHGSDSDDQSISVAMRAFPWLFLDDVFIITPYGRGPSNAFSRDNAQEDIREAVADALREYPIDSRRLVLTGFSMGGYGVYRTLYENPKMYVAASVFSGHPELAGKYAPGVDSPDFRRPEFLKPLRGANIAVIHGGRDRNCPVELTVDLVARMKRSGLTVHFLLDREAGHEPPRDPAIIEEYRRWLEAAIKEK
jgi:predicted esterase